MNFTNNNNPFINILDSFNSYNSKKDPLFTIANIQDFTDLHFFSDNCAICLNSLNNTIKLKIIVIIYSLENIYINVYHHSNNCPICLSILTLKQ